MEKNLLNHYILKILSSFKQNLSAYSLDKESERLHRLRVDIKKIKAVLAFAEKLYKKKYNATKLKPLFFKAGKIRELQINIHLLSGVPHPPKRLLTDLEKKEAILIQKFIRNSPKYIKLIKHFRKEIYLPKILPNKKIIKKYFKKEKKKAKKTLKIKDRESLHKYRTKIKKLMYIYNALPNKIKKEIELNEIAIEIQEKKIGGWHDLHAAIEFLSLEYSAIKTSEYFLKTKEKEKRQFNALLADLTNNCI